MQKVNFLVFGGGAREHAIAQKLSESIYTDKLFLALHNDGFAHMGEVIDFNDYTDLAQKAVQKNVDILVVGPENPLCEGIADVFKKHGIKCIGVDKKWSELESSKCFAKKFMERHNIKTANYKVIVDYNQILKQVQIDSFFESDTPYVIKADGLCKGKGVRIAKSKLEAIKTIEEYLNGKFGEASKTVILEEFLDGDELSLMSLWDGKNLLSFLPARDFKRLNSDPSSPNTGGMGAFCPIILTSFQSQKLKDYEQKLKKALELELADFTGFIYSGLIWCRDDFYVLEYNVRLGDPETQAILTHLDSDLGEIFVKTIEKKLDELNLKWKNNTSACLVIAADTYPEESSVGEKISGLPEKDIFFAGVKKCGNELQTNGGRILSICKTGELPFEEAKEIARKIEFKGRYFREDLTSP